MPGRRVKRERHGCIDAKRKKERPFTRGRPRNPGFPERRKQFQRRAGRREESEFRAGAITPSTNTPADLRVSAKSRRGEHEFMRHRSAQSRQKRNRPFFLRETRCKVHFRQRGRGSKGEEKHARRARARMCRRQESGCTHRWSPWINIYMCTRGSAVIRTVRVCVYAYARVSFSSTWTRKEKVRKKKGFTFPREERRGGILFDGLRLDALARRIYRFFSETASPSPPPPWRGRAVALVERE